MRYIDGNENFVVRVDKTVFDILAGDSAWVITDPQLEPHTDHKRGFDPDTETAPAKRRRGEQEEAQGAHGEDGNDDGLEHTADQESVGSVEWRWYNSTRFFPNVPEENIFHVRYDPREEAKSRYEEVD
jgi:hypothetical protein